MEIILALLLGLVILPASDASAQIVAPRGISAGIADGKYVNSPSESVAQTFTAPLTVASSLTVTGNAFSVGGSTLVVTGGKVGIGDTTPGAPLQVVKTGTALQDVIWVSNQQAVAAGVGGKIVFTGTTSDNGMGSIESAWEGAATTDGAYMAFAPRVAGGATTERMRLPQGGGIIVRTASAKITMVSPDGTCSACGPDNSDVWACASVTCP